MRRIGQQTKEQENEPTVGEAIKLWIRKAKANNCTDETLKTYELKIKPFREYFGDDTLLADVTQERLDDYKIYLIDKDISEHTVAAYIRHARALLYYAMDAGMMPYYKIKNIKTGSHVKDIYTPEQLEKLLKRPNGNYFPDLRIWALESFLASTGCRLSTALDVKIKDINFDNKTILFRRTKSRQQYSVPLENALETVLEDFLEQRGGEPDDYVFCSLTGTQGDRRTYQYRIQQYNIKRNVNVTSAHAFRRTFATTLARSGASAFEIQQRLGHSSIAISAQYVKMSEIENAARDQVTPLGETVQRKNRRKRKL